MMKWAGAVLLVVALVACKKEKKPAPGPAPAASATPAPAAANPAATAAPAAAAPAATTSDAGTAMGSVACPPTPPEPDEGGDPGQLKKLTDWDLDGDGTKDLLLSQDGTCDGRGVCNWNVYLMKGDCGTLVGALEASDVTAEPDKAGGFMILQGRYNHHHGQDETRYHAVHGHFVAFEERDCGPDGCEPFAPVAPDPPQSP